MLWYKDGSSISARGTFDDSNGDASVISRLEQSSIPPGAWDQRDMAHAVLSLASARRWLRIADSPRSIQATEPLEDFAKHFDSAHERNSGHHRNGLKSQIEHPWFQSEKLAGQATP